MILSQFWLSHNLTTFLPKIHHLFFLCQGYLMVLPTSRLHSGRMTDELEKDLEGCCHGLRYYPSIFMEGLRKNMKNLSQDTEYW
jgi:hypothetical protein